MLCLLNIEAAVKQTQDFKQLRNEKKILEKEFKKTQVLGKMMHTLMSLTGASVGAGTL